MVIQKVIQLFKEKSSKAQSFVELALVLPIILLILLGLVEVTFFIARYLDVMDLTREAARFASTRDPKIVAANPKCSNQDNFNFYYHTACILAPPSTSPSCTTTDPNFCGELNSLVYLNPELDDILIEVFMVTGHTTVETVYPQPDGYWALSDHDLTPATGNWKKDCQGAALNPVPTPHYTAATVSSELLTAAPMNKGFVGVEFYYCYSQVLAIPIANWFVPNPLRIHAYTLMPLPAAQPTPTLPSP
jgi:hypothetical protein